MQLMISLVPIPARTSTLLQVAQIPQANTIKDKSCPNLTTIIHNSSGYSRGAAQIQHVNAINGKSDPNSTTNIHNSSANDINDKSHPNSTTNIHNSSGYARGTAQIPLANSINDRSHPTIHQVMLEVLPKFHRQMILMTSLIPIRPRTSTILQVMQDALPRFHI
jgi:hypothetical protein